MNKNRIAWVDYSKGICIILVVLMHSTGGVEKAAGALSGLHPFIVWAQPFRMPDFFLISGLFLASRINLPWRKYLDSKLVHFVYFYVLWMTIQFAMKSPGAYAAEGASGLMRDYALGLIEPYGTLWFIYLLAIFFVLTKALKAVPAPLVFICAAVLQSVALDTHSIAINEFAGRYVYFFAGYWLAPYVFRFADAAAARSSAGILSGLFIWGVLNASLVDSGWAAFPGISLALGFAGALAVVSMGVLCSRAAWMGALRYCGQNSLMIYLAFVVFMGPVRAVLLKLPAPGDNLTLVSLIVTAVSITGALILFWLTRATAWGDFLFHRPAWAHLKPRSPVDIVGGNGGKIHKVRSGC